MVLGQEGLWCIRVDEVEFGAGERADHDARRGRANVFHVFDCTGMDNNG